MSKANSKIIKPVVFAFSSAMLLGAALSIGNGNVVNKLNEVSNAGQSYVSDYGSKQEAFEAGLDLNEKICDEGMVLLKNENNALPLKTTKGTNATRVSVFGFATMRPDGGGKGEQNDGSAGHVTVKSDIYSSLEDAGFKVNPVLYDQYKEWDKAKKVVESPSYKNPGQTEKKEVIAYNNDKDLAKDFEAAKPELEKSFDDYNDAAIVMLKSGTVDAKNPYDLRFDEEQHKLVDYVASKFDKVILIINNSKPVELKEFRDNANVDSILIAGNPGDNGFNSVGKILSGEVNPSGRLSDIYPADLTKDPTYNNFSKSHKNDNWLYKVDGKDTDSYFVDYEEGIYVGYRYYETRGYEEKGTWYKDNVAYPFGAGLSYTNFNWTVKKAPKALVPGTKQEFIVEVTNTGKEAGKDVVELYLEAPYTKGGIEKSAVVLVDFGKTKVLAPGESQELRLRFDVNDLASYDFNDANKNNFKGYELEAGDYKLSLRKNSHEIKDNLVTVINVADDQKIEVSEATGNKIENRFDDVSAECEKEQDTLSRVNLAKGTTAPTEEEMTLTAEEHKKWSCVVDAEYDKNAPWTATEMPTYDKNPKARKTAKAPVQLEQLIGKSYDDPLWDKLLDQLSLEEMQMLIENGGFGTIGLDYIGKPYAKDTDGPKGWTGNGTAGSKLNMFAAEPVIAATWNKELAYDMGELIGDQGIWGNSDVTNYKAGDRIYGYTGWYAPAMNTHRSPFDGRFAEYYSEDGTLAGQIAANVSLGAKSKGSYVFAKHFVCHDDGGGMNFKMKSPTEFEIFGYRGGAGTTSGLSVWANEQTLREIYLKPFQITVEDGSTTAVMSAFNRLGTTWCGGSYALLTDVLRNEWGFEGMVVTDLSMYGYMNGDQMIRAGGDIVLTGFSDGKLYMTDYTKQNPATQVAAMRRATKNVLYTVANSHAMQIPKGAKVFFNDAEYTDAEVGKDYKANFGVADLNTAYKYSDIKYELGDGDLPEGLDMDEKGVVTGKPTKAGTYTFNVEASADGYEKAIKTYTINVTEAPKPEKPVEDDKAREDIGKLETELTETKKENEGLKGLATGGLVVGILGLVTALGTLLLNFFKRK